jgi:riboflavin kinase
LGERTKMNTSLFPQDALRKASPYQEIVRTPIDTLVLKGRTFTGKGEGAKFIGLRWVKEQIEEKLGFLPYPGTLNIRLTQDSLRVKTALTKRNGLQICPVTGYFGGVLYRARLQNVECAIVVPEIAGYPEDVVEVVASVNLRERLGLRDGASVEFEVTF